MSVRSWPMALQREATEKNPTRSEPEQRCIEAAGKNVQLGKEEMEEKINALFKTCIHLMNTLTEMQEWIQEAIYSSETLDNIKTNKLHYDECWREFVNMHERYIQLLVCKEEKDIACRSYEEQMTKKINLDEMMVSLQRKLKLDSRQRDDVRSFSGKSKRSSASKLSHSSRFSTVSKKKEQLALAQLKRSQARNGTN